MIKKILLLGFLSCGFIDLKPVVAVGDTQGASTTFQFSVGLGIYDISKDFLWTLSGQDTSLLSEHVQSYGIAYTQFISPNNGYSSTLTAYPYLPSQAIVTTMQDGVFTLPETSVPNPLLGKKFSAVTFLDTFITAVTSVNPSSVYVIQASYFNDGKNGTVSPDGYSIINQFDLADLYEAKQIAGLGSNILFIASAQGTFGTNSSQISFASRMNSSANIAGQVFNCLSLVEQASISVDPSTQVLNAHGADLAAIGSSVALYPIASAVDTQIYAGFDVTAGLDSQAVGLCKVQAVLGSGDTPSSIFFDSIMPDSVALAGIQTPVSTSALHRVVVGNITTTTTSTGLSYIITSRYDESEIQSIYAMPMVTMALNNADNGKIANFDSIAQNFSMIGITYRTQGFDEVIDVEKVEQINIAGSADVVSRLQVGAGRLPLATGQFIEQLVAQGDAVYVTIQESFSTGCTPGMFKSQALFDAQGRIKGWSPWQRVTGTDDQMLFAIKNRITSETMYVSGANSDTIQQTTWNTGSDTFQALNAKVIATLPKPNGGVQAVIPFPSTTEGFTSLPEAKVSMLAITGDGAVVVAQTGQLVLENFEILDQTNDTSIILNEELGLTIGSVVSAVFGSDYMGNNWLFMAGDGGLSVLSKEDGSGFATLPNDGAAAYLISEGQTCKTLGSFSFIKKIVNDGTYIYIMTQDAVYRFLPLSPKFTAENPLDLSLELVVQSSDLGSYVRCTDMLVDRGIVLLGTTAGLYSINAMITVPGVITPVEIPGGLQTVSCLQTISTAANFNQSFYTSSNLYVLSINYSLQQARLNRFTITNGVVEPIQDQLLQGQNGPLLYYDYMNNSIFIDGSLGFATSYRVGTIPPTLKYMQYTLQAGRSSTQILLKAHTTDISVAPLLKSLSISGMIREYATGALIMGGDFGLAIDL